VAKDRTYINLVGGSTAAAKPKRRKLKSVKAKSRKGRAYTAKKTRGSARSSR
jgi:hypothetical protein